MPHTSEETDAENLDLLSGGEMRSRIAAFDWSRTPLGPAPGWPQSLKSAVEIMLTSRYPMLVWWGPALVQFYNDAYMPVLGQRHPWGLGQPAAVCWEEAWPFVGALADAVISRGVSTWSEELEMVMTRNGFPEEVYMTFSYSPIVDASGGIGGLFCACTEETQRVLGRRRLAALGAVSDRTAAATTTEQACASVVAGLTGIPRDLPFTLLYLLDEAQKSARLVGHTGIEAGTPASPSRVSIDGGDEPWPFSAVMASGGMVSVDPLPAAPGAAFPSPWAEPTRAAVVLPLTRSGRAGLAGFLVAGISPRLLYDESYRTFLNLLARQVATALAAARAFEEEQRRAQALLEIDRAKTAFFSNVSHEFRTPLTLILGTLEEALSDGAVSEQGRARLAIGHRNSLRLLRLVNTLLDFSRVEAGRAQARYEATDLAGITADLASSFRSACEAAGLTLRIDCPPLDAPVHVDREMWEKIVLNLVSNAFKFTLQGAITVSVRREGEAAVLAVRDTGVGIPEAELGRIFERFHRIENAGGRSHEGSGIGLALVKELVGLNGGAVAVESEEGRGATFTVRVPFGTAHLPADRIADRQALASTATRADAYVEEALRWLPDQPAGIAEEPSPGATQAPAAADARRRVLVVDDNADMRDYLRQLLQADYEVTTAADGEQALARIDGERPDLVLADVMMPRLDGFGLLKALRGAPATQELSVILLSARAGEEARVEGLEAGADDYLVKPFSARELLARVAANLQLAELRHRANEAARKSEGAERQALLLKLSDAFGSAADPTEIRRTATQLLGERLELGGACFFEIERDASGGRVQLTEPGFQREPDPPGLAGRYSLHDSGSRMFERFAKGEVIAVSDIETDSGLAEDERAACRACAVAAFVGVPLPLDGRYSAGIGVYDRVPRAWKEAELDLIREVAERTRVAVERARAQAALRESEASLARELASMKQLQEISGLLIEGEDEDALYGRILEAAMVIMRADSASIQTVDAGRQELRLLGHRNLHPDSARFWDRVPISPGSLCGDALREGERLFAPDASAADPGGRESYRASGIVSVQSTPLTSRDGRLVGVMSTYWRTAFPHTEKDFLAFDVLARQTADAFERARVAGALRESEQRRDLALQAAEMGTWDYDLVTGACHFDARAQKLYSLPSDALGHHPEGITVVVHPDDVGPMLDAIRQASDVNGDGHYEIDYRIAQGDGHYCWLRAWGQAEFEGEGAGRRAVRIVGASRDVTPEKDAERQRACLHDELVASRSLLAAELAAAQRLQAVSTELISEQQPEALYEQLLDAAMVLMKADAASVQILEPGSRLRLLASRHFHPDSAAYWQWVDASSRTTCGIALETNARVLVDDVERSPEMAGSQDLAEYRRSGLGSVQSTPLLGRDGRRLGMLSTHWRGAHHPRPGEFDLFDVLARQAADLIERSAAEAKALRESEERLRGFGNASQDILWIRDAKTLAWTYLTPAFEEIYGLSREEALRGDNFGSWLALIVPEDRAQVRDAIDRVLAGGHASFECRIHRRGNGEIRWLRETDFPIRDEHGRVVSIGGIGQDVTSLKAAEESMRTSEERLRSAAEVARFALWDWNVRTGEVAWSDEHFRMEGYAVGEVTPGYDTWVARVHPDDRAVTEAAIARARDTRTEYIHEFRSLHPDGSVHWHSARGRFFYDEGGVAVRMVGAMLDTTERRESEERQKVLVAELQHRTFNLMGMISSTVDATIRSSASLDDFALKFRDRIAALARVQRLLSRLGEDDRVTFDELIRGELDAFGALQDDDGRVVLEGPGGVALRSGTVQTLAMALHELTTNAVKYGALKQHGAHLAVRWRVAAADTGQPWLHVDWRETRVAMPPPDGAPQGTGQGRTLIEKALPYQLRAKTTYVMTAEGVHCSIALPVSTRTTAEPGPAAS